MKRLIASFAFVLWLMVPAPADAQDDRGGVSGRRPGRSARTGVPSRWQGKPSQRHVSAASNEIIIDDGVVAGEYYDDGGGCDSCGGGGCDSCSVSASFCDGCSAPHRFCICFPSHGWVHAEYLSWYQDGMRLPALATTSPTGTARAAAGVLGQAGTSVLFGDGEVLTDDRAGFRIRFGTWLGSFPGWGIEGEYTGLDQDTESFFQQSSGTPIIARPFFNALTGAEDSELVAFPGVVTGALTINATTQFDGAAVRLRKQLCCSSGCGFSELCCQTVPTSSRLDGTIGYRFWELDESLRIHEALTLQTNNAGDTFDIIDQFSTRNQFNGTEVGFLWQGRRGWWSLDGLMRLGIGNIHQTVTISGSSVINESGTTTNHTSGFLAQRTNIGTFDRDKFTIVPELGATLGYQLTRRLRGTIGYSLIYMGNVVRPGDQVDLDVNPNLLPPQLDPFSGPLRPQFQFVETDYWVQGLSFGGEFRW